MYMKPFSEYWKTDGSAAEWTCICKIPRLRAMPLPGVNKDSPLCGYHPDLPVLLSYICTIKSF